MIDLKRYAVLGNPIEHSLSPLIHRLFAEQTGIKLSYEKIQVPDTAFPEIAQRLLCDGYRGLNITLPFKERALSMCHQLTERARQAGAVNTIYQSQTENYLGDNTDGVGLLTDLERLSFIRASDHILLLGAGGAARGIIAPLLAYGCRITMTNRTLSRAEKLASEFATLGQIEACAFDELKSCSFNLILNATSAGVTDAVAPLPNSYDYRSINCYDLYYRTTLTPFLNWVNQQGCLRFADGLGMLVAQAAHAFKLWHGVMPDIGSVLQQVQQAIGQHRQ